MPIKEINNHKHTQLLQKKVEKEKGSKKPDGINRISHVINLNLTTLILTLNANDLNARKRQIVNYMVPTRNPL